MIETQESREEFEKRREKAKAALRAAVHGDIPLAAVVQVAKDKSVITTTEGVPNVITADSELCDRCKEIQRLRTQRSRKRK